MAGKTLDLTRGGVARGLTLFALPCVLSGILQNLYNIVDTVIVGRMIDTLTLAAVGATGSLVSLFTSSVMGLMSGFSVVAGKRYGAGDYAGLRRVFANALLLSAIASVLVSGLGVAFARGMLALMRTPADIIDASTTYFAAIMAGFSATVLYNFYCEMLRALGNSRAPMLFFAGASVLHIALAILFIRLDMGVAGAALATVLSQAAAVAACVIYTVNRAPLYRFSARDLLPDGALIRECLSVGVPTMATNFIVAFGVIILQFVTNGIGTEYVTAYSCASRIGYIITTPITGFSSAAAVFAAQNLGAGNAKRIREGVRTTLVILTGLNVILFILSYFVSPLILRLMITDGEEAVSAGILYLKVRCTAMFILAVASVFKLVLTGLGRPLYPTLSGVLEIAVRYAAPVAMVARGVGFLSVPLTDASAWAAIAVLLFGGYLIEMKKIERTCAHEKQAV